VTREPLCLHTAAFELMYTYPYSDCPRLTVGIYHHDTMMCSATLPLQYTPVHQALPICHLAVSLETGHVDRTIGRTESIREQEINQLPGINSIHADLHCGDDQTHMKAGGSGAIDAWPSLTMR